MLIAPETWHELFEAVYEIHSAKNHDDFGVAVVAGMKRLITADVVRFQLFDREGQRLKTQIFPPDPFTKDEVAYYTSHSKENPLIEYYEQTKDPLTRRMSDVIDLEEWTVTNYYRTCLARQDLKYCLALPITVDAFTVAALSFNRSKSDFTLHDCELLDAFAPHFRLAWTRHANPWVEQRQIDAQRSLQALGLSPRASEVLFWMTEGKQNREIATILGIQLGTVQEYVAGILEKLGQENRHAATVFALKQLGNR